MRNPLSNKEEKAMELLTKAQFTTMLANGTASAAAIANGDDPPEHFPVVKLFNPCGAGTWLLSEIDPECHDHAFGLCDLGMDCAELGSVSLGELRSIRLPFGLGIERDIHWTATHPLIVYARASWKVDRIVTDRASLDAAAAPVAATVETFPFTVPADCPNQMQFKAIVQEVLGRHFRDAGQAAECRTAWQEIQLVPPPFSANPDAVCHYRRAALALSRPAQAWEAFEAEVNREFSDHEDDGDAKDPAIPGWAPGWVSLS